MTYPRICDITSKGKYINLRQKLFYKDRWTEKRHVPVCLLEKENPESTKPDLVLENGKIEFSGSGGNHVITFKNNIYEYKVFHNKIAASGIADITLVVEKNGKEILSEDGKLEGDTTQTD